MEKEVTIEGILSELVTDMAVKGATFDELALVIKMSKDIIDILNDYKYEVYKRKYKEQENRTMEKKTLYLIVRPTFPKWEDGILDEYISLVGIFDSEKASNQICQEHDGVFEVKLNHIYPVDVTGMNFNPEEILIGGAWRDKDKD